MKLNDTVFHLAEKLKISNFLCKKNTCLYKHCMRRFTIIVMQCCSFDVRLKLSVLRLKITPLMHVSSESGLFNYLSRLDYHQKVT